MKRTFKIIDEGLCSKPIIKLDNDIRVLIDSGANRNIWIGSSFKLGRIMYQELGKLSGEIISATGDRSGGVAFYTKFNIGDFIWDRTVFIVLDKSLNSDDFDAILSTEMFSEFSVNANYYDGVVEFVKMTDGVNCLDALFEAGVKSKGSVNAYLNSISESKGNVIHNEDMLDIHKLFEDAWNKAGDDINDL